MEVKPGQKIPLSAVIPDGTSGLVVKSVLQKMDGTILTTVTLTEVHPGVHADQSFAMPSGLDFVNAVYTVYQAGGIIPQPGLGSWNELFEAITPMLASGLKIQLGCEDQPTQSPVQVVQTSDLNLVLSFVDDSGKPVDTSQATAVIARLKKADGTTMTKAIGSGITAVSGAIGQYLVQMLAADFALLPTGEQTIQAEVDLGGVHYVEQLASALNVQPSIV